GRPALMKRLRNLLLAGPLLAAGCLYGAREHTDQTVAEIAAHPFDRAPDAERVVPPARGEEHPEASAGKAAVPLVATDVQTTALLQPKPNPPDPKVPDLKERITIPKEIPGAETPAMPLRLPDKEDEKRKVIRELYPPLPALPAEPTALPGPDGKPY